MQEWKKKRTIKTQKGSRTYDKLLSEILDLEEKWVRETMMHSNPSIIKNNENFKKIIDLAYYTDPSGKPALDERVACIMFDRIHIVPWYMWAIDDILRHRPYVPDHLRGRIAPITEIYQRWGRSMGMTDNDTPLENCKDYDELDYYDAWIENNPEFKEQVEKAHNDGMDVRHLAQLIMFEIDEKRNNEG